MKLYDLFVRTPRQAVIDALRDICMDQEWPQKDNTPRQWMDYHVEAYNAIVEKMVELGYEDTKIKLDVEPGFIIGCEDTADAITSQFENSPFEHGYKPTWAIEFQPWRTWLGMELSIKTMCMPDAEVIAWCLWEMTFISNDEEDIRCRLDDVTGKVDAYKKAVEDGTIEYKTSNFMDLFKDRDAWLPGVLCSVFSSVRMKREAPKWLIARKTGISLGLLHRIEEMEDLTHEDGEELERILEEALGAWIDERMGNVPEMR